MGTITLTGTTRATFYETMFIEACANCGMAFGMTKNFNERRRNDAKTFYCPNGHSNVYDQALTELELAKRNLEIQRDATARVRRDLAIEKSKHAATKGTLTKTRNRANAGVCLDCARTFANIRRHREMKHGSD